LLPFEVAVLISTIIIFYKWKSESENLQESNETSEKRVLLRRELCPEYLQFSEQKNVN
jgi:hypothetical protein